MCSEFISGKENYYCSVFPFIANVISKCMMEKECVPANNYMKGYQILKKVRMLEFSVEC